MSKTNLRALLIGLLGVAIASPAAKATENENLHYVPGTSVWLAASIPPPYEGLYLNINPGYFSASKLVGSTGDQVGFNFKTSAGSTAIRALYVSPAKFLGGDVAFQAVLPFVSVDLALGPFFPGGPKIAGTAMNLGDPTVGPIVNWRLSREAQINAGVDFIVPLGRMNYDVNAVVNTGSNYLSVQPVLGASYSVPNGLDLHVLSRVGFNTENKATSYKSGTEFQTDFAAGWNIGQWRVGVAGAYLKQLGNDTQFGAIAHGPDGLASGNKGEQLNVGPSINYTTADRSAFSLSWQSTVYARNQTVGDRVYGSWATRF